MTLGKKLPPPTKSDKRMLLVSSGIFIATCLFVVFAATRNNSAGSNLGVVQPPVVGTAAPIPTVNPNATPYPTPLPLTGEIADQIRAVQQMVADCKDYSTARRDQMNQHFQWLLQPSSLPQSMLTILGTNSTGRLIFGMSTYTLSEWGQHAQATDSCLLPIGKKLNELLASTSEEHFNQFDG